METTPTAPSPSPWPRLLAAVFVLALASEMAWRFAAALPLDVTALVRPLVWLGLGGIAWRLRPGRPCRMRLLALAAIPLPTALLTLLLPGVPLPVLMASLLLDAVLGLLLTAIALLLQMTAASRHEAALRRLDLLKLQLPPHLLHNVLNSLAALVRTGRAAEAITMISRLGDLLRQLSFSADRRFFTVREELTLLRAYLDIERARYGDRLIVHVHEADDVRGLWIPSLLLQPLVENAVKHAMSAQGEPLEITVEARRDGEALLLAVSHAGTFAPRAPQPGHRGGGLGLRNTEERLALLYRGSARLIVDAQDGHVAVRIRLPLDHALHAPH